MIRAGVIGVGHLGSIHARIYAENPRCELVGVVDSRREQAEKVASGIGTRAFDSVASLAQEIEVATVSVPTAVHPDVAIELIENGIHVLVEKPLAATVRAADRIVGAARSAGVVLQVGHVERFNPVLEQITDMVISPRFLECTRLSPYSFRSSDISVVHDLMIHDLDIIRFLLHRPQVRRVEAIGVEVISSSPDIANARITFDLEGAGVCAANVTASRVAAKSLRQIKMFQKDCYISIDLLGGSAQVLRKSKALADGSFDPTAIDPTQVEDLTSYLLGEVLDVQKLEIPPAEQPLQREINAFLDSVSQGAPVAVSGDDGREAVALAEQVVAAIEASDIQI